ncbi:hypothetical protein GIB67_022780 [Kingdonia uniflora]|uniref:Recombination initiation defects 3 n=1 Tax=Kingdonia uniflora TaxID=39325 RepID=A0A7J7P6N0_9MAGN|nr:hypothetical protein GIB67_022780 [Kingdonia uniflora]
MKLKINKVCDLNSISVLPPHSRRSNVGPSGGDSSSAFGRSQGSQLRSQQSQQSFSQGISSQLSQNSLDEILVSEQRFGSHERENSVKRTSCLAPVAYSREESQMPISRSSNNVIRRWSSASAPPDYRCQVSEELEHRIGLMETSLNRFGLILDSVQSDVMQVNKAVKEVSLETEGIRQKLAVHDNSMQLMLKGEEDIKASIDGSLKSIPDQLRKDPHHNKFQETMSGLLNLPDQIEVKLQKLRGDICRVFTKEMEAMMSSLQPPDHKDPDLTILQPKRGWHDIYLKKEKPLVRESLATPANVYTRRSRIPKIEVESRESLKRKPVSFADRRHGNKYKEEEVFIEEKDKKCRIVIESDEEVDEGFFGLFEEKETGTGSYLSQQVKLDAERILKKARRRKRKHCNPIIIC